MIPPPLPRGAARAIVAAFLLVLLLPAGQASAKVTWKGIGPARIGMTEAQVRARLGTPTSVKNSGTVVVEPRKEEYVWEFTYRGRKLKVALFRGRVIGVRTTSRAHRTSAGVGVGLSMRKARRRVKGERCDRAAGRFSCSVERNGRVLEFVARGRKVGQIAVGRASLS
jgi:hypothetical protein